MKQKARRITAPEQRQKERETALQEYDFSDVETYARIAGLNEIAISILIALVEDHVSDSPRTYGQIADHLGIHENTVLKYRRNALFNRLHRDILREIFHGNLDKVYRGMMIGVDKGQSGMVKLAMEMQGEHTPTMQSLNVNVNRTISDDKPLDIMETTERYLTMLGAKGWSLDMIAEVWNRLKSEQAF